MGAAGSITHPALIPHRVVAWLAWIGVAGWGFFLPLSQAHQHIKATSIAIFVILGSFLLGLLIHGFRSNAIRPGDFQILLPLAFLALLPMLHAFHSAEAEKQLVLRAPFFALPFLLIYTHRSQAAGLRVGLLFFLAFGFILVLTLLFSQGPVDLFREIRNLTDDRFWWVISRPYLGLWTGLLVFGSLGLIQSREKRTRPQFLWLFGLGLSGLFLAFWVLAKLAILGLVFCGAGYALHSLWRKPFVFLPVVLIGLGLFGWGIAKIGQSQVWDDFTRYGEIRFSTVSKTYANSVNNRLILWRSAVDLLTEKNHWTGLAPDDLQKELDIRVARYNGYLTTVHLNPHNQFLSMLLGYGYFGIVVWGWVWLPLFRVSFKKGPSWFWGTVFLFLCSQGEVYWDREMGVQVYILWGFLLLSTRNQDSSGPALPLTMADSSAG